MPGHQLLLAVFAAFISYGLTGSTLHAQDSEKSASEFWQSFAPLSGMAFEGDLVHAPEGDTTFAGKQLVMHVQEASDEKIAIHFFVGDDRSRTWLMTKVDGRIQLKHDHRHEDGKEDKITMYGGLASNTGSTTRQVFPADQETTDLLPAAASNVWWIDIQPGQHYTYNMRRLGTDRYFSVKFDLTAEIKTPPAAWGWE